MKKCYTLITTLFICPLLLHADTFTSEYLPDTNNSGGAFGTLLSNILGFTNTILIPFIIGIGFLVFVWGMFQYFIAGGANDEKKEKGKSLMIYATLGFVFIIILWGVVNLIVSSTGLNTTAEDVLGNGKTPENRTIKNVTIP